MLCHKFDYPSSSFGVWTVGLVLRTVHSTFRMSISLVSLSRLQSGCLYLLSAD